jgi:hypothetical protein
VKKKKADGQKTGAVLAEQGPSHRHTKGGSGSIGATSNTNRQQHRAAPAPARRKQSTSAQNGRRCPTRDCKAELPTDALLLQDGDTLVLSGEAAPLALAEEKFLKG